MYTNTLRVVLLGTSLLVAGCGVTYNSPTVHSQAAGFDVAVIALTASTLAQANGTPYQPRALPAALHAIASGPGLRSVGPLPDIPDEPQKPHSPVTKNLPPQVASPKYKIGIGDVITLVTKGNATTIEELGGLPAARTQKQGFTVRDNGAIALPNIGQVQIVDLTLEDAEAALFQALVAQKIDPAFSLEVAEFNSQSVSVGGLVGKSGLLPITIRPLRLGDALSRSGGVRAADPSTATVILYRGGKQYQVAASDLRSDVASRNLILHPDDVIYVDEGDSAERARRFYEQQIATIGLKRSARLQALSELDAELALQRGTLDERRANFVARQDLGAEQRDFVYLVGEVKSQGRVALPYEQQASLADILYDEGGFNTKTGDPAQIYVIRPDPGEDVSKVTAWHLNATNVVNLTLATRLQMRPNDIVFIEEQPITKWSRAFEQAFPILINKGVNGDSGPAS